MMRRKGQVHILRKITVSNSLLASWCLSLWKCYASMVYPCTNPAGMLWHIQPACLSGLSLAVEHLQYILWNMYIFSVEQQQNIRVTLIMHFSHPNKASLTRHVPHHIYPAGSTSLSIPPFLSFLFFSLSLYLPVTLPLPLSPLFLFPFYFLLQQSGSSTWWTLFSKSIIMHHCKDTCSNQLNHLANGLCTIKLKCFASVDQMDVSLFSE